MDFQLGQPFRPYQQLMGVLPDRSKSIVPEPYHTLMTNPDSPIFDFYPRDFTLDMNGKKMDWEAVVKIPFIDENRLLSAMKARDKLLSDAEKERNEFGVTIKFTYSPDLEFVYPSSLVGQFPDISHCHCVENIFDLPTMEGLDIHVGLMNGVKLGQAALAGFPTLKTLPHTGNLSFHGVSIFQQDSRNESMLVTILDSEQRSNVRSAKALLGRKVHVGFPFLSEAKVIRVSDELFNYSLLENGDGLVVALPHGPLEIDMWRKKAERIERGYSKRLGMMVGQVESLVHVDMLKGLKKTDEGATIKEYAHIPGVESDYASQTIVSEVASEDLRFIEKHALPIQEEFPVGTRAFFLGDFAYGRPLEVVGHTSDKADIWVSTTKKRVPEFGRDIATNADRLSPYTPSFAVAKMLNLSPLVLSKITSAFQVNLDDNRVNLGLNLKFEAKKLKVLGYSRKGSNGWEFSEKAIQLLQQYMLQFPEFIAGIQRNPQGNTYEATDFYPKSDAKTKIKEIQAWLKTIESKSFEKVPLEAAQLDSDIVHKVEVAADEALQIDSSDMVRNKRIKGVPRSALLKPSEAEHRLGHQQFALGDRIVYVQDSGRVPIASQGTVVGMTRTSRTTLLDVVFDVTFMSGTSLEDRCSPFRGSTVPIHSVLNVTHRQLITESRAAESHRPQPQPQPATTRGYGAPTGPNGQGQFLPARTPAPLRGSFRGAFGSQLTDHRGTTILRGRGGFENNTIQATSEQMLPIRDQNTGQANGFRGRGGSAIGLAARARGNGGFQQSKRYGYGRIDQGNSDGGIVRNNSAFQPQLYTNVPPPPNLDSSGRGRARGGIRGGIARGEGTRGRGLSRGRATLAVQQQ